jgi:3,4-dihydroxy 2-butanone 4-phosphate synthase/GTP cyclohydrolase II
VLRHECLPAGHEATGCRLNDGDAPVDDQVVRPPIVAALAPAACPPAGRPVVTLSYAQSLDGSIAAAGGAALRLSGAPALELTHQLRSRHDAILVGIGTVLVDDPRLTVRLVPGASPQPIVLDSRLRFPLRAQLLQAGQRRPWIATTAGRDNQAAAGLVAAGAEIIVVPATACGRVDLPSLLATLAERGVRRLMVEGGASVITSFLDEHLVDHLVVTVTPRFVGGMRSITTLTLPAPALRNVRYEQVGDDLVVSGDLAAVR